MFIKIITIYRKNIISIKKGKTSYKIWICCKIKLKKLSILLDIFADLQQKKTPLSCIFSLPYKKDRWGFPCIRGFPPSRFRPCHLPFLFSSIFQPLEIQGKLVPKLTLSPFLTLSARNGPNLQSYLFQAYISWNPSRVKQNYTIHLLEMNKTIYWNKKCQL